VIERWGVQLDALEPAHEGWSIIGGYLGQLVANLALVLSCERVVLGGGVMSSAALLPHVRGSARACLNQYLPVAELRGDLEQYIVAPGLGDHSGLIGALVLAQRAHSRGIRASSWHRIRSPRPGWRVPCISCLCRWLPKE
jgi:fructokinase